LIRQTFTAVSFSVVSTFFVACSDPHDGAVEELHDRGQDFTVPGYLDAASAGDAEAVRLYHLAGMGVDVVGASGDTALVRAAAGGKAELVRFLITSGAEAKHVSPSGKTALLEASRVGDAETVGVLLTAGANPLARDAERWAPLNIAAFNGHAKAVALLAPVSRLLLDEALQLAALSGNTDVIDVLVNNGASVYARSADDRTALMYAAANGHLEAVKLLLKKGANRFALGENDAVAADFAEGAGYPAVVAYLNEPRIPEEEIPIGGGLDLVAVPGEERGAVPRLGGAVLKHDDGASKKEGEPILTGASVRDYRERQLPIMLESVDQKGEEAQVRLLYGGRKEPVTVSPGTPILDTGLQVVQLKKRTAYTKQGKGDPVDVSQMFVEDGDGRRHLVVTGIPARSSEAFAVIELGDGLLYDTREGDVFETVEEETLVRYRVVDVRPTQVVIENEGSGAMVTVGREGGG